MSVAGSVFTSAQFVVF